ncbi:MAG: 4-hydroxythreonine-4-phosphate dehydrogenase PdxA [Bacteroidia bacterium]|nr:4-hydroxythreonine-4-phosphate dehydrogenase PdxA [Bacteroidia bacterium]
MSKESGKQNRKPRIGISIGDINGIGMEVILKTFTDNSHIRDCVPVIYGNSKVLSYHRKAIDIKDFNFVTIVNADAINYKKLNLINCWNEESKIDIGMATQEGGKFALLSLKAATADLKAGKLDAIVTAPINKKTIQQDGFDFAGQTEYFASEFSAEKHCMMLVSDNLKISFVSGHVPLRQAAAFVTKDRIVEKLDVMATSLIKDFGIRKPKIAVLALNPHAGDDGLIGTEEKDEIVPAISQVADDKRMLVMGPYAADGFFGSGQYFKFDATLAMYHDQGLIPFKNLCFNSGVNYTAGLSAIRTSPDHGTAYDIAGKNLASEQSFRHALYLAIDILKERGIYEEITSNPLETASK